MVVMVLKMQEVDSYSESRYQEEILSGLQETRRWDDEIVLGERDREI